MLQPPIPIIQQFLASPDDPKLATAAHRAIAAFIRTVSWGSVRALDAEALANRLLLRLMTPPPIRDVARYISRAIGLRQRDAYRSAKKHPMVSLEGGGVEPSTAPSFVKSVELKQWLESRGLTHRERKVFELRIEDGFSMKEIGSILGISPATASVHLFRARKKIAAELIDSSS